MSENYDLEADLARLSDEALKANYQEEKARGARVRAIYKKIARKRGLNLDAKE